MKSYGRVIKEQNTQNHLFMFYSITLNLLLNQGSGTKNALANLIMTVKNGSSNLMCNKRYFSVKVIHWLHPQIQLFNLHDDLCNRWCISPSIYY